MAINQQGDVVGFANASEADGGNFNPRAFLWTKEPRIRLLGALPGDVTSQAPGSTAGSDRRPVMRRRRQLPCFLWENGAMTTSDLT